MKIIDEFKQFAIKGNVVDMAVGIIIGAAFGKIVDSLVKDVMMPPLGFIVGGIDFSNQELLIRAAQGAAPAVSIKYGLFLNSLLSFCIVALAVFMVVKGINALKRKEAAAPTVALPPSQEEVLLTEIRDLLRRK